MTLKKAAEPILTKPGRGGNHPPAAGRFQPGMSGNPGGKPKNARNGLQLSFLRDLAADFEKHGKVAIQTCRIEDPAAYLRVICALMPKEIELTRPFDDLTDQELDAACEALRAIAVASHRGAGTIASSDAQPAEGLPAISQAG